MDNSGLIIFIYALAMITVLTAIPVIAMIFTVAKIKRTTRRLFTFTLTLGKRR